MAKKSVADYLKGYKQNIDASRRWRKDEGYDATWRRLVDMYRGHHYEDFRDEDRLLVNIAFSTVNIISPNISVPLRRLLLRLLSTIGGGTRIFVRSSVGP